MAKVYVTKDSMTKDKEFLEAGSITEVDKQKDFLLFELGNVEEYDKAKHSIARDVNASLKEELENEKKSHSEAKAKRNKSIEEIKALEAQLAEKDTALSALEVKVADLEAQLAKAVKKVS